MPLGRSTATIGAPHEFIASIIARASPSTTRLRPAPNSASTMTPAPATASGFAGSIVPRPASAPPRAASPLSAAASPSEQQPHRIAALGQHPRRHEAIAAIVARACNHEDACPERMTRDRVGDRAAGPFHELDPRDAARNGEPVALRHFVRRQELDHGNATLPGGQNSDNAARWTLPGIARIAVPASVQPLALGADFKIIRLPIFWTNPRNGLSGSGPGTARTRSKTTFFGLPAALAWTLLTRGAAPELARSPWSPGGKETQ